MNLALIIGLVAFSGCGDDDEDPGTPGVTVNAGTDQTVTLGEIVALEGSGTDEAGGAVVFLWEITARPAGSTAVIGNPLVEDPNFTPDLAGSYTLQLTVTNSAGASDSDEVVITVEAPNFIVIDQDITTATTFSDIGAGRDYLVQGFIDIDAALVVEPGVTIHFDSDAGFRVSSTGSLRAVGTAADSIIFTGATETEGFWRGIMFVDSDNNINEFTYCRISYAGSTDLSSELGKANVGFGYFLNPSRVKFNNTLLRNADGKGISMDHRTNGRFPEFSNNRIADNNEIAMVINVPTAGDMDGNSVITNNGVDAVEILSKNSTKALEDNATWPALANDIPYQVEANILVRADLELSAGVILEFGSDRFMRVDDDGSLLAEGTMTDRILFTGKTKVPGFWRGLYFEDSNNVINELTYVTFEYGGSSDLTNELQKANFAIGYFLNPSKVKITNVISRESDGYGFAVDFRSNGELTEFSNNQFSNNAEAGMRINPFQLQYLDEATLYTDNNGTGYIEVYHSSSSAPIDDNVTWVAPADGSIYLMDCEVHVNGDLTINAGANFEFEANRGFRINGSLSAVGTNTERIVFTGKTKSAGAWKGMRFVESNSVNNRLHFVDISYGGSDDFNLARANLNVDRFLNGSLVDIQNSSFTNSAGYGIAISFDSTITPANFATTNTFSGNATGSILD